MTTYAAGDIQGCLQPLLDLLERVAFNPKKDRLWVVGDLVNRGPDSLDTLRFLRSLGSSVQAVLGNHDLHLLAVAQGVKKASRGDTLDAILTAHDREPLLQWLRQWPLVHYDPSLNITMSHAGIAPMWSRDQALSLSDEVSVALRDDKTFPVFMEHLYGNDPILWQDSLTGFDRLRCITNYCTRMRYCGEDGRLELTNKNPPSRPPTDCHPWFLHPHRQMAKETVIFGHWAALEGVTGIDNAIALDTGCVWGNHMTLMRLEDKTRFISADSIKKPLNA